MPKGTFTLQATVHLTIANRDGVVRLYLHEMWILQSWRFCGDSALLSRFLVLLVVNHRITAICR